MVSTSTQLFIILNLQRYVSACAVPNLVQGRDWCKTTMSMAHLPSFSQRLSVDSAPSHCRSEGAAAPDPPSHAEEADWRTPIAQRAWRYHLERAQPTKCLLDLLRSMQPGDWLIGGSLHQGSKDKDKAKSRSVEAIIKWLQVCLP